MIVGNYADVLRTLWAGNATCQASIPALATLALGNRFFETGLPFTNPADIPTRYVDLDDLSDDIQSRDSLGASRDVPFQIRVATESKQLTRNLRQAYLDELKASLNGQKCDYGSICDYWITGDTSSEIDGSLHLWQANIELTVASNF